MIEYGKEIIVNGESEGYDEINYICDECKDYVNNVTVRDNKHYCFECNNKLEEEECENENN